MKAFVFGVLSGVVIAVSSLSQPARAETSDIAYYQQFPYTYKEDADGNRTYRYMMSTGPVQGTDIGPGAQGEIFASMSFSFNPDGTFTAVYSENTAQGFPVIMGRKFTGNWTVPGQALLLGDIATGARAVYDSRNAVQLTFLKDLGTAGLKGKTIVFDYGYSNAAIDAFVHGF